MGEHEIREEGPLLGADGGLREAGYARQPLLAYDRAKVGAPAWRIKEWDYYCVLSGDFGLALTIADNGYLGLLSASVVDLAAGGHSSDSLMTAFPRGAFGLGPDSRKGRVEVAAGDACFVFETEGGERRLHLSWPDFGMRTAPQAPKVSCCVSLPPEDLAAARIMRGPVIGGIGLEADLVLREPPGSESIVMATPFAGRPGRFYYNRKLNCLAAEGRFTLGRRELAFEKGKAFGVLDWGRGVWPWASTWYWASASGLVGGRSFGLNLGYGFGDTSAATENAVFRDGRLHKLGATRFEFDRRNLLAPWRARSEDGRLDLVLEPRLDRAYEKDYLLLASKQHQVFGTWSGRVVLDDGEELAVSGLPGFAEKVVNRW